MQLKRITSAYKFFESIYKRRQEIIQKGLVNPFECYRGHGDKSWRLIPTIGRENLVQYEASIIQEYQRIRSDIFPDTLGLLDTLAMMQHYGMCTRLLDVTTNPAVALYFACCDYSQEKTPKDGEVFIFTTRYEDVPDNSITNMLLEFYIHEVDKMGQLDLVKYLEEQTMHHSKRVVEQCIQAILTGNYFVRPKKLSERMHRQSGAFFLYQNRVCNNTSKIATQIKGLDFIEESTIIQEIDDITDEHVSHSQNKTRYIVNANSKENILGELETIGIHEAFLFPELQYESKRILTNYRNKEKEDKM